MQRVITYVDGFNLYFGMKSKGWRKLYWLNLVILAKALLKHDQQLHKVHYFTSRIRSTSNNQTNIQRQTTYLEALACQPGLDIHWGHFLEKPRQCHACGAQWLSYEEKMTDVNMAVQMLTDAYEDLFDTAILISGDSDLTTPVTTLRRQFPSKRLIVAFAPWAQIQRIIESIQWFFYHRRSTSQTVAISRSTVQTRWLCLDQTSNLALSSISP